jgi:two-component system cell cycle response regulator
LIVEDERIVALDLRTTLERLGYDVVGMAASAEEALTNAASARPDLVLMDVRLRGSVDGIELASRMRDLGDVAVVFLTANADNETLERSLVTSPVGFLAKPFNERTLHTTIAVALTQRDAQARLRSDFALLRQESIIDPLTGLYNRRHLDAVLSRELEFAQRTQHEVALIMLDLDHFKSINDRFGHAAGDGVLRGVARVLRSRLRVYDTVCRYGGEEIVVVVPGTSLTIAKEVAEDLRVTIQDRKFDELDLQLGVTASLGVAAFPSIAPDADTLLRVADAALYRAKAGGRNRVAVGVPVEPSLRPVMHQA